MMWSSLLVPITLAATAVLAAPDSAVVGANGGRLLLNPRSGQLKHPERATKSKSSTVISHAGFPHHKLQFQQPDLCHDRAQAYSGYFNIGEHKQLFFFYAESRANPSEDPVVLWLNGGPGCSSAEGLLAENGPCLVVDKGRSTVLNKNAWNSKANVIFLDSPAMTGFSRGRKPVDSSQAAAKDVYAFVQLFYRAFPKIARNELNLMGESYAGRYIPTLASVIVHQNKNLDGAKPGTIHVPLVSMAIGNGYLEIVNTYTAQVDFGCGKGIHPAIYNVSTCTKLASQLKVCASKVVTCRKNPSTKNCLQAEDACFAIESPYFQIGLSPYDITKPCDRNPAKDGPYCDKQASWIPTYLNQPSVRAELGIDSKAKPFEICSNSVTDAFYTSGDFVGDTLALIPDLIDAGIRLLAYAGVNDFVCNYLSSLAWTNALPWSGHQQFKAAQFRDFKMPNGTVAGKTKSFGAMTLLQIYGAGHMAPKDKPTETLVMINRWLSGAPL